MKRTNSIFWTLIDSNCGVFLNIIIVFENFYHLLRSSILMPFAISYLLTGNSVFSKTIPDIIALLLRCSFIELVSLFFLGQLVRQSKMYRIAERFDSCLASITALRNEIKIISCAFSHIHQPILSMHLRAMEFINLRGSQTHIWIVQMKLNFSYWINHSFTKKLKYVYIY